MAHKLDLSNLTEEEADHVLQVVQRDMQLRKTEEERLSELKQGLDQEESRCVLLSRQRGFNDHCCIRCCSSFTFFLMPRRQCLDCRYNVCKRCCSYSEIDKSWLCSACEKSRLLKAQSLEWFYSNVRRRFKRFGSAKVLKMLYRRHVGDQGSQADFTEESTYAESTDDSVYESDSTFYKHTAEHSMAESISVALRVAKEAIDEAITKAETQTGYQKKQKQACYLRDNKGELIEELTTMILQTIICRRRDQSELPTECNLETPHDQNSNKFQSAFTPITDEALAQQDKAMQSSMLCTQGLKKDDVSAASWNQNLDWMESSCASSMLQSLDGNWFALQSTQQSRLNLPTRLENLMFSALEKESGVISAYDRMASDTESDSDEAWGHCKLSFDKLLNDHHATISQPAIKLPTKNTISQLQDDSDQKNTVAQIHKSSFSLLKRKVSPEDRQLPCQRHSAMGTTASPDGGETSEDGLEDNRVKRTRRRRRKRETTEGKGLRICSGEKLSLSEPDSGSILLNYLLKRQSKRQSASECLSDETLNADTPHSVTPDILKSGAMTPDAFIAHTEDPNIEHHVLSVPSDLQLTSELREMTNQVYGTSLLLTRNGLGGVEEPGNEIREKKGKKQQREIQRGESMCNEELDIEQEDSKIQEDTYKKVGSGLPNDEDNETENKKMRNGESITTCIITNLYKEILQETVEKQNAEFCASMLQEEHFDCKAEINTFNKKHRKRGLNTINDTDSERQIKMTEENADYLCERMHEHQNVEQGKNDESKCSGRENTDPDTEKKLHSLQNRAQNEPKSQAFLETDKQLETPAENCEKSEKVEYQEHMNKKKDTEYADKGEKDGVEDTKSGKRVSKEEDRPIHSQDHDFGEGGNLEYKRTEKVVKGFNVKEEEPELQSCRKRHSPSTFTDDSSLENEESMGKQNKQNQMSQIHETGFHNKRMNSDEKTQESYMENESRGNVGEKTEKHSCVTEEEQCDTHPLNDVMNLTPRPEEVLSPEEICKKYSAASLCSITTEVLKVLNATEDLIQGAMGLSHSESCDRPVLPFAQSKKLGEQLSRLEENVYVAASAVFSLEAELGDLEECARSISGETTEEELSQLEEHVASAAAQVQQSELQVSDIAARIAALKNAGLNVAPPTRFTKPQTIDSTRQYRRRLPAPPMQGKKT